MSLKRTVSQLERQILADDDGIIREIWRDNGDGTATKGQETLPVAEVLARRGALLVETRVTPAP